MIKPHFIFKHSSRHNTQQSQIKTYEDELIMKDKCATILRVQRGNNKKQGKQKTNNNIHHHFFVRQSTESRMR